MIDSLPDDILIAVLQYLDIPDILSFRQSGRCPYAISSQRIVWINACRRHVFNNSYPFPTAESSLESLTTDNLEAYTRKAYILAKKWKSLNWTPRRTITIQTKESTQISDVYLLPNHRMLTVSKGIWSVVTLWDLQDAAKPSQAARWSPKGAIFNGLALDTEMQSLAVGVQYRSNSVVHILAMDDDCLRVVYSLNTTLRPTGLKDSMLAISDNLNISRILNYTSAHSAILQTFADDQAPIQSNQCMQIIFVHNSILVIRARSIHLFAYPDLTPDPQIHLPLATHRFGWSDGVSVVRRLSPPFPALSLLVRTETDNPWAEDKPHLGLYTLEPNPQYDDSSTDEPPYLFPPSLKCQISSRRGALCCPRVVLGEHGTAVWIMPRTSSPVGLYTLTPPTDDINISLPTSESECLVASVFPGPLSVSSSNVARKQVIESRIAGSWTALDYDEKNGMLALGCNNGQVCVMEL